LASSPHLAGLRELDLAGDCQYRIYAEGLQRLLSAPRLTGLTALNLMDHHIGGDGFDALSRWPGLARLASLDLCYNPGQDPVEWHRDAVGLRALLESPHWRELRELDLRGGTMHDLETLEMVVSSPKVASLRVLYLSEVGEGEWEVDQDAAARLVA